MSAEEQQSFANSVIMYQTGKGVNHLVPALVTQDIVPALTKLADVAIRVQCGVNAANESIYFLAWAHKKTATQVDGTAAGVQNSHTTATKMRHFASTMGVSECVVS